MIQQVLRCFLNLGPRALEMLQGPRYLNPHCLKGTVLVPGADQGG